MEPHQYKVLQRRYNAESYHIDDLRYIDVNVLPDNISDKSLARCIVDYFILDSSTDTITVPAKSYAVAILYAALIRRHFGTHLIESLDDPELLCGNDKWFKPYSANKAVYDIVLDQIDIDKCIDIDPTPNVKSTINYFKREFYLI